MSHNPCFSGKLFAIKELTLKVDLETCHNPCFSGKLFAIYIVGSVIVGDDVSQSLF